MNLELNKKEDDSIIVSDYITYSVIGESFKTEAYYCTKLG